MARPTWDPQPAERQGAARKAYHAGYSDGYHGYKYGSGDTSPGPDYEQGFLAGRAANTESCGG